MYYAYIENGDEKTDLFYSGDDRLELLDPVLKLKLNHSGEFNFGVPATHPCAGKFIPLVTRVKVFQDDELIYGGRAVYINGDFYKTQTIGCEGDTGYFMDSVIRPFEYTGSFGGLFRQIVESHNSQVEELKRFEVGELSASSAAEQISFSLKEATRTMKFMLANIMTVPNTYVKARYTGGKRYVDLVSDFGGENRQPIRFGENLLDLSRKINPDNIITSLVPYGAQLEDDTIVDITSVNGGKDYITNDEAVKKYGLITGTHKWEDVTDPAELLTKGKQFLNESVLIPESFTVKAVDLSMVDVNVDKLKLGYWTTFESPPHGIKKKMLLSGLDIYFTNPQNNVVIMGTEVSTLTSNIASNNIKFDQSIKKVSSEIISKIANATALLAGGKGGYVVLDIDDPDTGKRALPWRILIMDTPDKETAKSVIQINKMGIGFSTTGINGPYRNAWTIDGNLVADFITAGTMLADRIRGGILEIGGQELAKNGKIVVKDSKGREIGYWDNTGLHVLMGTIEGTTINVGPFYVDDNVVQLGDYFVSTDGSNVFQSADGSISIQTAQGGPFGSYATIKLESRSGETELSDHHLYTGLVDARNEMYIRNSWWGNYSVTRTCQELWDEVFNSSDKNLKQNIKPMPGAVAKWIIQNTKVKQWLWKRDKTHDMGMIAQELDKTLKEYGVDYPFVGFDVKRGTYYIDYKKFIPVLIMSIQDIYNKLEEVMESKS